MEDKDYRSRIIRVAEEIIDRQGMKSLTIANIVKTCKISNRNFYQCFSSKEELLGEIRKLYQLEGHEMPDEKQLILEKAAEGISQYGFNNITLESIARSAGLNRGAIYKHFSEKYELLECCIEYKSNKTKQIMNLIFQANEENPENYIRKYVENYAYFINFSFDSSIFTETWSHMNYRPRIRELTYDLQEHFRGHVSQCLKKGMEQGVFKNDLDVSAVTGYISIMINGMAYYLSKRTAGGERIPKVVEDLMTEAFFSIIREKNK